MKKRISIDTDPYESLWEGIGNENIDPKLFKSIKKQFLKEGK